MRLAAPLLALGAGAALLLVMGSARSSSAPASSAPGVVQTAEVGDRVYTVARLGQGTYLVMLTLVRGVPPAEPVEYTLNQSGPVGEFGDPAALAQLKADLPHMQVNFAEAA